ncbi:anaphase-promoting complex subunit 1 isoform X4 [Hydra vulgaris]|uniref:Anaphase-promoting complex subunit 1 isoform X4 n=1 Tax=Hydra vulgaris TaxID=6087 RepID=A0ABM4CG12_HYDVU
MIEVKSIHNVTFFGRSIVATHPDAAAAENANNEGCFIHIKKRNGNNEYTEEEVYWKGRTVVVSVLDVYHNTYLLSKCFTVETDIKDVVYTKFQMVDDSQELNDCLCILEKGYLSVFTDTGTAYYTPLPFKVKKIWEISIGICVEREVLSYETEDDRKKMPILFSLLHPLEDFKPIVYRYQDSCRPSYFTDVSQHIIYTSKEHSIALSYDTMLGLHSIWLIKKAEEKDMPAPLQQQDNLPEFLFLSNQSLSYVSTSDTRLSKSPAPKKRHSCPPIPFQGWKSSPAGKTGSPAISARSPNANIKSSPRVNYINAVMESQNNESTYIRKSYTSSPMMFRMSCDESAFEEDVDPLPPDICMSQVWQEHGNIIRHGVKGKGETAFVTTDFYGDSYFVYFLKNLSKFQLLKMNLHGDNVQFDKVMELDCLDIGAFKSLSMYAVIDLSQKVNLYTGKQKVVTLELPIFSADEILQKRVGMYMFAATSFHIYINPEDVKRVQVHDLDYCNKAKLCISLLRNILSDSEYNLVCSKYYLSLCEHSALHFVSWNKFVCATLKLMGFPESSYKHLNENISSPAPPQAKKAKKSDSYIGFEDWEYVLESKDSSLNKLYNVTELKGDSQSNTEITMQKLSPLYKHIPSIFICWHQLYEELKLNILEIPHIIMVAKLLHFLASVFSLKNYLKLYEEDFPVLRRNTFYTLTEGHNFVFKAECESVFTAIYGAFQEAKSFIYHLSEKLSHTLVIIKVFSLILTLVEKEIVDTEKLFSQLQLDSTYCLVDNIINTMMEESFTVQDIETLPIAYKLPIKELFYQYKKTNKSEMSGDTAAYLNREDIVFLKKENCQTSQDKMILNSVQDSDGMSFDNEVLKVRFNQDLRIDEVKHLLDSSKPVTLKLTQKLDVNDHAFAKEEESYLGLLCNRTMSLPVARGMFTMGTSSPIISEAVVIPTLELSGYSKTNNKTVANNFNDNALLLWPSFHNGVAAGLKIAPGVSQVDSTWILFNKLKSAETAADHAGFLYALGLSGHLSVLPNIYLHDYLIKAHDLTTIALLIGISCTQIGSKNSDIYKIISLHLDSLLPPTNLELFIPQVSQVAAIISLGLLFFNTGDSHLAKVLIKEIGRAPGSDLESSLDRESHALASGFAFGMIMIGQGKDTVQIADLNVIDALYHYMFGGHKRDQFYYEPSQQSCQIQEGDLVNTDITCVAAVVALSLLYLKTNNKHVSSWLKCPISEKLLDTMKPDQLLLKCMAYNFIMWDELVPNETWLRSFTVEYSVDPDGSLKLDEAPEIQYYTIYIVAGCFLALGIKFAGSHNTAAFNLMFPWLQFVKKTLNAAYTLESGAGVALEQSLDTILLALCLVMAGSGNIKLLRFARQLHKRCSVDVTYGNHMATHMAIGFLFLGGGRYTLKTDNVAIACLLCSLYPKWPINSKDNLYHLQALRHLYVLACEPRLFVARDIETKQICFVPIQVIYKETDFYPETAVKLMSPCFLPELEYVKEVSIIGTRYWPIIFNIENNIIKFKNEMFNIYVKKKAGYLSYSEDPKGNKNLLMQFKLINSDPDMEVFSQLFCTPEDDEDNSKRKVNFFCDILYDCVLKDKLDILSDYISIEETLENFEAGKQCNENIKQLNLLLLYYEKIHPKLQKRGLVQEPLLNSIYMMQTSYRLQKIHQSEKHTL